MKKHRGTALISSFSLTTLNTIPGLLFAGITALVLAGGNAAAGKMGDVYHRDVCPPVGAGLARCYSQIVTDVNGGPLLDLTAPVRGYTPAQLRDAA